MPDDFPQLTSELDHWTVTLKSGEKIEVAAHAYAERDEHLVFVALCRGEPHLEVDVAAIPVALVDGVNGGGKPAGRLPSPD
jgi:hypothetical protein